MFTASELLENFNSHIAGLQFTRTPKGLYAPVEYVLSMGGKRIRPVLMLLRHSVAFCGPVIQNKQERI